MAEIDNTHEKTAAGIREEESQSYHLENSVLDINEDPHVAALHDSPDKAERPSWSTILAIFVSQSIPAFHLSISFSQESQSSSV